MNYAAFHILHRLSNVSSHVSNILLPIAVCPPLWGGEVRAKLKNLRATRVFLEYSPTVQTEHAPSQINQIHHPNHIRS